MKKLNKEQKLIILIAMVTVIVIIGIVIGANAIRTNIANGSYESSNSGSNNGNLLPEYIKKGITLGGVTGTLEDLDTSDATATVWDITYGKTAYVKGEKIEGVFVPRSSLKVGDYVSYTPDTATTAYSLPSTVSGYSSDQTISQEKDLKWQIFSINDDGTIDLISSTSTSSEVYLTNAVGYNNGVFVLNDICSKLYANNELNAISRSIKQEDITDKMNSTGKQAQAENENSADTYTYTDSRYTYYPLLCARENGVGINTTIVKTDGIGISDSYYTTSTTEGYGSAESLTIKKKNFTILLENVNIYFDDDVIKNLFFSSGNYWIASRSTNNNTFSSGNKYPSFSIKGFRGTRGMINQRLFDYSNTTGTSSNISNLIRPIVELDSNIILYGGDGTEEHPYQLLKNKQ